MAVWLSAMGIERVLCIQQMTFLNGKYFMSPSAFMSISELLSVENCLTFIMPSFRPPKVFCYSVFSYFELFFYDLVCFCPRKIIALSSNFPTFSRKGTRSCLLTFHSCKVETSFCSPLTQPHCLELVNCSKNQLLIRKIQLCTGWQFFTRTLKNQIIG